MIFAVIRSPHFLLSLFCGGVLLKRNEHPHTSILCLLVEF